MVATLPAPPAHAPIPDLPRRAALVTAGLMGVAVALAVILGAIPTARDIWVKEANEADLALPALWLAGIANLVVAALLIAVAWLRLLQHRAVRVALAVLGIGALLQALGLLDAAAASGGRDPRLADGIRWTRAAALGDVSVGLLMLFAAVPPRRLLRWARSHARTLRGVFSALLITFAFSALLAAGPEVLAAVLTAALLGAGALTLWRHTQPATLPSIPGMPVTRPGRWAVALLSGFLFAFAVFLWAIALGARGGETFFSNPFLSLSLLTAGVLAIAAGLVAAVAVITQRERAPLALFALALGTLVALFGAAEVLFPH